MSVTGRVRNHVLHELNDGAVCSARAFARLYGITTRLALADMHALIEEGYLRSMRDTPGQAVRTHKPAKHESTLAMSPLERAIRGLRAS